MELQCVYSLFSVKATTLEINLKFGKKYVPQSARTLFAAPSKGKNTCPIYTICYTRNSRYTPKNYLQKVKLQNYIHENPNLPTTRAANAVVPDARPAFVEQASAKAASV